MSNHNMVEKDRHVFSCANKDGSLANIILKPAVGKKSKDCDNQNIMFRNSCERLLIDSVEFDVEDVAFCGGEACQLGTC